MIQLSKWLKRNSRGFTLLEVLVSVSVATIIAYTIFTAMRSTTDQVNTANAKMTTQTSAREGLYRMLQELRTSASSRISIGNSGDSVTFDVPNSSTPVNASYGVNWGNSITYALGSGSDSDKIIRTDNTTGSTKVIATDVTSLEFTGNAASPSLVTVGIGVQRALTNGRNVTDTEMQISGQAQIRNASSGGNNDDEEEGDDGSGDDDDHGSGDDDGSGDDHGSGGDHDDHS